MRKLTPFLFLLVICSFAFTVPDANEGNVKKASEKSLSTFLAKIPVGQETSFGFSNRAEFDLARIGKPFHTITFNADFYKDENLGDKNYLMMQNEWRVPVTVNGDNRILLTVNQQDDAFVVNDIGGAGLAIELQQRLTTTENGSNFILRIYPLAMDILVHVNQDQSLEQGVYIPMNSALASITGMNEKTSFTQAEIFRMVNEKLKEQSKK